MPKRPEEEAWLRGYDEPRVQWHCQEGQRQQGRQEDLAKRGNGARQ